MVRCADRADGASGRENTAVPSSMAGAADGGRSFWCFAAARSCYASRNHGRAAARPVALRWANGQIGYKMLASVLRYIRWPPTVGLPSRCMPDHT